MAVWPCQGLCPLWAETEEEPSWLLVEDPGQAGGGAQHRGREGKEGQRPLERETPGATGKVSGVACVPAERFLSHGRRNSERRHTHTHKRTHAHIYTHEPWLSCARSSGPSLPASPPQHPQHPFLLQQTKVLDHPSTTSFHHPSPQRPAPSRGPPPLPCVPAGEADVVAEGLGCRAHLAPPPTFSTLPNPAFPKLGATHWGLRRAVG